MHTWYPEFVRRIISRGPSRGIDSQPIPTYLYAVCMDSLPTPSYASPYAWRFISGVPVYAAITRTKSQPYPGSLHLMSPTDAYLVSIICTLFHKPWLVPCGSDSRPIPAVLYAVSAYEIGSGRMQNICPPVQSIFKSM